MKSITKAVVYFNSIPTGELEKNPSGYVFRYFESYLADKDCPAISISLPKRAEPFQSKTMFPFFFGLLSEGENKEIICKTLRIDPRDNFSLLINSACYDTIGPITVRGISQ
jgi:HipA-like protein